MIKNAKVLVDEFKNFTGNRYLSLATNSFQNSKGINFSSLKYNNQNVILQTIVYDDLDVNVFDLLKGINLTGILVDTEFKNDKIDLEKIVLNKFPGSKIIRYGSNDVTLHAFDLFLSTKISKNIIKEASVYGAGYLGTNIAAKLANRGILVNLATTKYDLAEMYSQIGNVYHNFKQIRIMNYNGNFANSDLHIGCTSGVQVVQKEFIEAKIKSNILLDVGGNNFTDKAQLYAKSNANYAYYLSIDEALLGWLSSFNEVEYSLNSINSQKFKCGHTFIPKGRLISDGEVLVDALPYPTRIFGIYRQKTGEVEKFECECITTMYPKI
jgi:hypothetical protein